MRRSLLFFSIGILFCCLFILFSYLVHKDLFTQFDFNTTVRLQDNLPRRIDNLFSYFSIAGNFEIMLLLLLGILIIARKIVAGIAAFAAFGFFHVIELFSKLFVNHPPPPEFMLRTEYPIDMPQFHVRADFSYPSGHSGRTVFLSVLLLFLLVRSSLPGWMKVAGVGVIVGIDVTMLVSRVYLGEHWTTDVIGGVLLSVGLSLLSLSVFTFTETKKVR